MSNDNWHPEEERRGRGRGNVIALLFLVVLVAGGWWLAGALTRSRNTLDCLSSGRRNCGPVIDLH